MSERQRRSFTEDYKRQAVELAVSSGRSIGSVAKELGLRDSVLRRWVDKFRRERASAAWRPTTQATPMSADQASEIARLRQENERLRMERASTVARLCGVESRSLPEPVHELPLHRGPSRQLSGTADVCRARGPAGRLLCLARASGERPCNRQCRVAGREHRDSGQRYGSPRVHAVLQTQGRGASRGRIERLMRRYGIRAIIAAPRRVRTTDSRHNLPIAPNLIARDFTAAAPNRVWLADITYIPTAEGWLYLAAVMDLFSRKIVGWAMGDHMRVELVSSALLMALRQQRPAAGLIHHSDRGVQYASHDYRAALAAADLTASMSRKADCYDNAPMESFFHTLKTELVHHRHYKNPCRGPARHLRLHRGLLQSNPAPFRHRISPPSNGAKSRLTRPLFRGKINHSRTRQGRTPGSVRAKAE